jgi:hypothetical protein
MDLTMWHTFCFDAAIIGRGLPSSTFQLNLSRFRYKIYPTNSLETVHTSQTTSKQLLNATPIPQKVLTLSRQVDECRPLIIGGPTGISNSKATALFVEANGRGLHSSTIRLNVSPFCGKGCAFLCCAAGLQEVSGAYRWCIGCIS